MSSWSKSTIKRRIVSTIPTFHILIATVGRPCLKHMLDSLQHELNENDAITIVFDGKNGMTRAGFSNDWLQGHRSTIRIIEEENALGYWGHGIRNKYQGQLTPKTTYIMHADDDDVYVPAAFDSLRRSCIDPNSCYIARISSSTHHNPIPSLIEHKIIKNDIATPCGIIPFDKADVAKWEYYYGGDFDYYDILQSHVKHVHFLYYVIYNTLPSRA